MHAICHICGAPVLPSDKGRVLAEALGTFLATLPRPSLTAPALLALLYPAPEVPDRWVGLRGAIEDHVPALGDPPRPESYGLALVLRSLTRQRWEGGPRIVVEGRTAGRARWRVVGLTEPLVLASTPAPTPVSG